MLFGSRRMPLSSFRRKKRKEMDIDGIICGLSYDENISEEMKLNMLDYIIKKIGGVNIHEGIYQIYRLIKPNRDDTIHLEVSLKKKGTYKVSFDVERGTPKQFREKVIAAVRKVIVGTSIVEQKTKGPGRFHVSEGEYSIQGKTVADVMVDIERQLRAFASCLDAAQEVIDDFTE